MGKQSLGFNRALGDMAETLNSDMEPGEQLQRLVRSAARAMGVRGCSLMLLDAQRKRLFHTASRGLTERYLRKGFLEPEKSLSEVLAGRTVAILDVAADSRIQYRELAQREGIASMLAVPVRTKQEIVGTLRVYSRTRREFTTAEEQFLVTVSSLVGVALDLGRRNGREIARGEAVEPSDSGLLASRAKAPAFAHPSEEEFARLLDFYQIEWMYEPRSFVLEGEGKASEMFTPDFYLPALDLYVEMTTLKPGLTSEKRRKVRALREQYPAVNVRLVARRDYDHLLAKYGHGPLAGSKTRGVGRVLLSAPRIQNRVCELAKELSNDYDGCRPVFVGVLRGVFFFMADLMSHLAIPADVDFMALSYFGGEDGEAVRVTMDIGLELRGRHVVLVEDIVDTGMTLSFVLGHLRASAPESLKVCTLLDKRVRRLADVELGYVGFEVPDEFLVGYGLDYQEEYRNLPFIALMEERVAVSLSPDKK